MNAFFKKTLPFLTEGLKLGGGPVGAIAADAINKALGTNAKPEDMEDVITKAAMTEDGRLKLQQAEQDYQVTMTKMGFDHAEKLAELDANDRDSARKRELGVKDKMPMILAILAVLELLVCLVLLAYHVLPSTAEAALLVLIGTVSASYKDVYGYYFGSSASSDAKTQILANQR